MDKDEALKKIIEIGEELDKMHKTAVVFDIEADGLLYDATKIHCICIQHVDTTTRKGLVGPPLLYTSVTGNLDAALAILKRADVLIGHNITGYDIPLLKKFSWADLSKKELYDTFIASCLIQPNSTWGHSIEAWGQSLGYKEDKVPITDWSVYTPEMGNRCRVDVGINCAIFQHLLKKEWEDFPLSLEREQKVAMIHAQQELTGVRYDVMGAINLIGDLDRKINAIRDRITKGIPPKIKQVGTTVLKPWKKNGDYAKVTTDWFEGTGVLPKGQFSKIGYTEFNLDSPQQVVEYLLGQGWKPTDWNTKREADGSIRRTTPKITEESFHTLPDGFGKSIGEYRMMSHRRKSILNYKDKTKGALATVRSDGRVPAEALTCGTPTSRYRHMKTVCNIPRPSSPYGKEIRGLFIAEKDAYLLGLDLASIEARMLAHYIMGYEGGKELASIITDGDYHSYNAKNWGVTRGLAKNGLYGLLYGCSAPKLASILCKPAGKAKELYDIYWDNNKPIKLLVDNLEMAMDARKDIKLFDGRVLDIRQKRLVLNTLLQGAAAVVFKEWMIQNDETITTMGWENKVRQVLAYHDEIVYEIRGLDYFRVMEVGSEFAKNATRVGEFFKILVPITAVPQIGGSWCDVH